MHAETNPALVLNADFRPLSYFPLSLLSWQEAISAVVTNRVAVVAEYEAWVRSPSTRIQLPSVIALKRYERRARRVAFTRFNVFLRDRFTCQYCGRVLASSALTFDHVLPRSRGGATCWSNVVTACAPCNTAKADRVLPLPLRPPREPTARELMSVRKAFPPNHLHSTWLDYLYWDVELDFVTQLRAGLRCGLSPNHSAGRRGPASISSTCSTGIGRLRWSGRHPVLKTGGHCKVRRSNRQPSANYRYEKAWVADLVKAPRRSRGEVGSKPTPGTRAGKWSVEGTSVIPFTDRLVDPLTTTLTKSYSLIVQW